MLSHWHLVLGLLVVPMVVEAANQNSVFQTIDTTALTKAGWKTEDIQKVVDNVNMVSSHVEKEKIKKLLDSGTSCRRELSQFEKCGERQNSFELMAARKTFDLEVHVPPCVLVVNVVPASNGANWFFRYDGDLTFTANAAGLQNFSTAEENVLIFEKSGDHRFWKPSSTPPIVACWTSLNAGLDQAYNEVCRKRATVRDIVDHGESTCAYLDTIRDPADGSCSVA